MYPKFVQGMGGEQSCRWWWWTRRLTRRLTRWSRHSKRWRTMRWMVGWRVTLQWRYWLSAWVTQLQHLNGAKGLHTILQGLPGGVGRGQGHGALLKSVWHTAAWLVLWQWKSKEASPVTLACEDGQQLEAHKVILEAISPFSDNMPLGTNNPHPHINWWVFIQTNWKDPPPLL